MYLKLKTYKIKALSQPYLSACERASYKIKRKHFFYVKNMTDKALADYIKSYEAFKKWEMHYNLWNYLMALDVYRGWKTKFDNLREELYGN